MTGEGRTGQDWTLFEAACLMLVAVYPDLAPPRVIVSELPRPFNGTVQWAVKLDTRTPKDAADRLRACDFLNEYIEQRGITGVEVAIDGRAPPGWLEAMVELEDRLGGFPPGGAGGGVVARWRRKIEARLARDELMRWQDDGGRGQEDHAG